MGGIGIGYLALLNFGCGGYVFLAKTKNFIIVSRGLWINFGNIQWL
jgi:hypothetical protein